ncbi:MAG: DUF1150 family protein [Pseudomonadota bacterium]
MNTNPTETESETEASPLVYVREVAGAEVLARSSQSAIEASGIAIDPGDTLYAVHDESGQPMAVFSEREAAFAAARWHGAEPVSVH